MTTRFFIQWGHTAKGPFSTEEVESKVTEYPACTLTRQGYGTTGTCFKVKYDNRWRRVYSRSYGNGASLFINVNGKEEYVSTL